MSVSAGYRPVSRVWPTGVSRRRFSTGWSALSSMVTATAPVASRRASVVPDPAGVRVRPQRCFQPGHGRAGRGPEDESCLPARERSVFQLAFRSSGCHTAGGRGAIAHQVAVQGAWCEYLPPPAHPGPGACGQGDLPVLAMG